MWRERVKKIIITGGSSGFGKYLIAQFLEEGYLVINIDVKKSEIEAQHLINFVADISNIQAIEEVYHTISCRYENIDILINNASLLNKHNKTLNVTPEEFRDNIHINFLGYYYNIYFFNKIKKNKEIAKVFNISSSLSYKFYEKKILYSLSKNMIIQMTKMLSKELYSENIYIYSIAPSYLDNDIKYVLSKRELSKIRDMHNDGNFISQKKIYTLIKFYIDNDFSEMVGNTFYLDNGMMG